MYMFCKVIVILAVLAVTFGYKSYIGYELIKVYLPSQFDIPIQDILPFDEVDVWKEPRTGDMTVDVMLTPSQKLKIHKILKENKVPYTVLSSNVQSLIHLTQSHMRKRRSVGSWRRVTHYMTYPEMMMWLDRISLDCKPMFKCLVFNMGRSSEGRDLKLIRIGTSEPRKPIIWIDAGLHAREWIAPAAALAFIEKLILGARKDPSIKQMVDNFTWYILPMANPDGYDYTWYWDRFWRKTRSLNRQMPRCRGVDANRNWDFFWTGPGNSINPCANNFRGPTAFSEPETRAMAEFLRAISKRTILYLTLHSYGQYWLTPWGYTRNLPQDYTDLVSLAKFAVDKLRNDYNASYTLGSSATSLYVASGGSDDWAKGVTGIKYSYTIELAESGLFGFIHSPNRIRPISNGLFEAIKAMSEHLATRLKSGNEEFGSG